MVPSSAALFCGIPESISDNNRGNHVYNNDDPVLLSNSNIQNECKCSDVCTNQDHCGQYTYRNRHLLIVDGLERPIYDKIKKNIQYKIYKPIPSLFIYIVCFVTPLRTPD